MSDDGPRPKSQQPAQAKRLAVEVVRHGEAWTASGLGDATLELAAHAAFAEGAPTRSDPCTIAILLTDDAEMRTLNRTWRDKDAPTDVLSFPSGENANLGDIAIAFETTRREAQEGGLSLADHVSHLVVHGVLHLLGFDHPDYTQAEQMEDLERRALATLGIADPYLAVDKTGLSEMT
jgi:probable rRNA maturation factor